MKYRPNATVLCNEAFLMFSHNKTGEWLAGLSDDERETLLKEAKTEGRNIRKKIQERIKNIEKERLEKLRRKENELKEKKVKEFKKREKMTNDILYFGLWQSENDIINHLSEITSSAEKKTAVKAQITFRKKVLRQVPSNTSLFTFSSGKKTKSQEELKMNLLTLINEARTGCTTEKHMSTKPLLVDKYIKHKFDDSWYIGHVLSVVPSFATWYNVKYKNDPAVYVFELQKDYAAGDLVIIPKP